MRGTAMRRCDKCNEPIGVMDVEPKLCEVCMDKYERWILQGIEYATGKKWEDITLKDRHTEAYYFCLAVEKVFEEATEKFEEALDELMKGVKNDNSRTIKGN